MSNRPRRFSKEFKLQVVLEYLSGTPASLLNRRYQLTPTSIPKWLEAYRQGRLEPQPQEVEENPLFQEVASLRVRNAELERMVGKLAFELEILKKSQLFQQTMNNGSSLIAWGGPLSEEDAE